MYMCSISIIPFLNLQSCLSGSIISHYNFSLLSPYLFSLIQTTNPGNSPLSSLQDYQKWEEFLSSELQAIKALSSVGELYEGAEAILSTFQTSDYWVRVNIENAAVSGSIYGIVVSFLLCFFIVVLFSHDWRLVVSMATTILAILLVLCALFYLFGWTLGIVEAISLSILVGNSLDYCIHLSEAFISIEQHQLGVVERSRILKVRRL